MSDEIKNLKSIFVENLDTYLPGNNYKDGDYLQITEWPNGEGWDFKTKDQSFSLTFEELDLINYLIKKMEYESSSNE